MVQEIEDILVAALIGAALVLGAAVTGQGERLCEAIGGTFQPEAALSGGDVCPDGQWRELLDIGIEPYQVIQ